MLCRPNNKPHVMQDVEAMMVWMNDQAMVPGKKYVLKHTSNSVKCVVKQLRYRTNITTLHREEEAQQLGLNEIGRVVLRTAKPIFADEYRRCRATGSFILCDEGTNTTVGAGMIVSG
jgi:sulfate adenylyltransferase subunit 1 (EFTu-like GTPase family)